MRASEQMLLWHASRQPAESSASLNVATSPGVGAQEPRISLIRHFPHVPAPPHGVSIVRPARPAASRTFVPGRTNTDLPACDARPPAGEAGPPTGEAGSKVTRTCGCDIKCSTYYRVFQETIVPASITAEAKENSKFHRKFPYRRENAPTIHRLRGYETSSPTFKGSWLGRGGSLPRHAGLSGRVKRLVACSKAKVTARHRCEKYGSFGAGRKNVTGQPRDGPV